MAGIGKARLARFACAAALAAAIAPSTAAAWNTDYPLVSCYSSGAPGSECRMGYTHALTYNSGTSVNFVPGLCIYAITAAGNIRGGGRVPCTASGTFINECFSSGPLPASEGRTYAYNGGKYLKGHADDSPNHTGCF